MGISQYDPAAARKSAWNAGKTGWHGGSDDGGDNASDASDSTDTADADYLVDANANFILDANGKRIKKPKTVDFSTLDVGGKNPVLTTHGTIR